MADEEVLTPSAASPTLADHHKRKHDELTNAELEVHADSELKDVVETDSLNKNENTDSPKKEEDVGQDNGVEAKRPRLEDSNGEAQSDDPATHNGYQENTETEEPKEEEPKKPDAIDNSIQPDIRTEESEKPDDADDTIQSEEGKEQAKESLEGSGEPVSDENEKPETESIQEQQEPKGEAQLHPDEDSKQPVEQQYSGSEIQSRKVEVPNDKVGVLIGKAGDTIRSLQDNSGAKIQIMRDADADPRAATRPVELIGSLENINRAEKLIRDVIAEADAGGSPSLVARGFSTVQSAGEKEQLEMQVPNEKVGLIIGKGGDTIKNLQTRSQARIQLIPQHLPEGDQSKERTVRITGTKKQIEMAREMIKEVMSQTVRPSPLSSGYSQQAFRPRGPGGLQWGPRGTHNPQYSGYDYPQRGPYPSQSQQYPPTYGNYPPQHAPRSGFGPSWEQRPPLSMQVPPHQGNYNYGQPQGPDYGQRPPYSQAPAQHYGHGYNEVKYDHHTPSQHYGQMGPQPIPYGQSGTHPGYGPQEQYGKPPAYGVPPQGHHAQAYGQPRPNQPAEVPYQVPISSTQAYGQNMPPQQSYPYASSAPMQQTYPSYGSVPSGDGYSHAAPVAAPTSGYPPQGVQPVAGYGQPSGQQPAAYAQAGPTGSYSQYPTSQPGYTEQQAASNAAYGYQGATEPAYGSQVPAAYATQAGAQPGYVQPAPTQAGYDQSVPQSGGYASVPPATGYGKSVSPQPVYQQQQYDSTQVYGSHS